MRAVRIRGHKNEEKKKVSCSGSVFNAGNHITGSVYCISDDTDHIPILLFMERNCECTKVVCRTKKLRERTDKPGVLGFTEELYVFSCRRFYNPDAALVYLGTDYNVQDEVH